LPCVFKSYEIQRALQRMQEVDKVSDEVINIPSSDPQSIYKMTNAFFAGQTVVVSDLSLSFTYNREKLTLMGDHHGLIQLPLATYGAAAKQAYRMILDIVEGVGFVG